MKFEIENIKLEPSIKNQTYTRATLDRVETAILRPENKNILMKKSYWK